MDEDVVLQYIYDNRDGANYINLLDYFINKFPNPTPSDLTNIRLILEHLIIGKNYVTISDPNTYKSLGKKVGGRNVLNSQGNVIYIPEEFITLDLIKTRKENNENTDGIMVRILPDGKKEIEERKRMLLDDHVKQLSIDNSKFQQREFDFQKSVTILSLAVAIVVGVVPLGVYFMQRGDTVRTSTELKGLDTLIKIQQQTQQELQEIKQILVKDSSRNK